MKKKPTALIIEDEYIISLYYKQILEKEGFNTLIENTGIGAIEKVNNNNPELILIDIGLKGELDGIKTALLIKANNNSPIIFITANPEKLDVNNYTKKINPYSVFGKPIIEASLINTINELKKSILIN